MFRRRTLLLMLGATLMVGAFSLIDGAFGGGGPQQARGAAAESGPGGKSAPLTLPPVEPIGELMTRLRDGVSPPPPPQLLGRNIFALTNMMRDRLIVSSTIEGEVAEAFREPEPTWTLRGVVFGDRPLALINDRIVGEGAMIGDYRVERITRDKVILTFDERRVELIIDGPIGSRQD